MKKTTVFVTLLIAFQIINAQEIVYKRNYPNIGIFMEEHQNIAILFDDYMDVLEDSLKYTSIQEFDMVFEKRDSFIVALNKSVELIKILENWDNQEFAEYPGLDSDDFYTELESTGVTANFAEGMMFGISTAPIMMSCIKEHCKKDYYLYVYIRDYYSYTINGEYPFYNLDTQKEIITASEDLFKNYPNSEYLFDSYQNFYYCLYPYVDIHLVNKNDFNGYIVGGKSTEAWPGATSIDYHQAFISEHSNSVFYSSIVKIMKTMSEISQDVELIYYIEVPFINQENVFSKCVQTTEGFEEYENAKFSWMTYLWNGIDIAHILSVPTEDNPDEYKIVLAYRFYEDKEMAERNLITIIETIPEAEIKTVTIEKYY
jgi:hypothetical protein